MASGDTSTCSSNCVTFAANCANVVVASLQDPKVTRARNSLPLSFDTRLTKPVRRAVASISSEEKKASIMGSATLCLSRWTQRRRRQLHCVQNCRKHRARLLTEKALCSRGSVRPGEEKVVCGGEALPLAWQVEPSQLMVAQGQVAVAPLHIGTRALEHGRQYLGLFMELASFLGTQLHQGPTGLNQGGAQSLGECPKRFATADGVSFGHALEIVRGNELGVHGEGDWGRQGELSDQLSDITRDELDGASHFRHHPLGFFDAFHAALTEFLLLGNGANLLDVLLNICGDELAVAAHPAFQIDKVVVVADAPDTRRDLCTLLSETLVLTAGRFECLLGLLQTHECLWGAAWTALLGLITRALRVALQPFELRCGFGDGL